MQLKKIIFCATCATILLSTTPSIYGIKDEIKKEKKQTGDTSVKSALAEPIADVCFAGISLLGIATAALCGSSLEKTLKKGKDSTFFSLIGRGTGVIIGLTMTAVGLTKILKNLKIEKLLE